MKLDLILLIMLGCHARRPTAKKKAPGDIKHISRSAMWTPYCFVAVTHVVVVVAISTRFPVLKVNCD